MILDIINFILKTIIRILEFLKKYIPYIIVLFCVVCYFLPDEKEPVLPSVFEECTAYVGEGMQYHAHSLYECSRVEASPSYNVVPPDMDRILEEQQKEWMDEAMKQDAMDAYRDYEIKQQQQYDNSYPAYGYPW